MEYITKSYRAKVIQYECACNGKILRKHIRALHLCNHYIARQQDESKQGFDRDSY